MTTLTRFIAPALVASLALGAAVPAAAAPDRGVTHIYKDMRQFDRQIDTARLSKRITRREALRLELRLDRLQAKYRIYARGGLNRAERRSLRHGLTTLKLQMRKAAATRPHRGSQGAVRNNNRQNRR